MLEWIKDAPSPLEALKSFTQDRRSFEAGDPVDWKDLGWTARRVYKLIHDGYLEDPTLESKSVEKRLEIQKGDKKEKKWPKDKDAKRLIKEREKKPKKPKKE